MDDREEHDSITFRNRVSVVSDLEPGTVTDENCNNDGDEDIHRNNVPSS